MSVNEIVLGAPGSRAGDADYREALSACIARWSRIRITDGAPLVTISPGIAA